MANLGKITIRVDETRSAQAISWNPVGRAGVVQLSTPPQRMTLPHRIVGQTANSWWADVLRRLADSLDG